MRYARMPIEVESPEEYGYARIRWNLSESSVADQKLSDLGLTIPDLTLLYGEHRGRIRLRELIAAQGQGLSADDVLVTTGSDPHLPLQTALPGVFAIGDVRAGSTKRVAAAGGEGAAVVAQIHSFLAQASPAPDPHVTRPLPN